jgi:hypothetical protein
MRISKMITKAIDLVLTVSSHLSYICYFTSCSLFPKGRSDVQKSIYSVYPNSIHSNSKKPTQATKRDMQLATVGPSMAPPNCPNLHILPTELKDQIAEFVIGEYLDPAERRKIPLEFRTARKDLVWMQPQELARENCSNTPLNMALAPPDLATAYIRNLVRKFPDSYTGLRWRIQLKDLDPAGLNLVNFHGCQTIGFEMMEPMLIYGWLAEDIKAGHLVHFNFNIVACPTSAPCAASLLSRFSNLRTLTIGGDWPLCLNQHNYMDLFQRPCHA